MTEEEIMAGYDDQLILEEQSRAEVNNLTLAVLLEKVTHDQFEEINEYLHESECTHLIGIVKKDKVFGQKQDESEWFKYAYVNQQAGACGDDYSGTIFIPIGNEEYLQFEFQM